MARQFKGFDLFDDIEDSKLRTRNRGVVMANIAEDSTKEKKISPKGAALILGYMLQVPEEERMELTDQFKKCMNERGYALV